MSTLSVIVTTYERPDALDRVLESLARQRRMPREVIVADDGSKQSTAECISRWQQSFPCSLRHVWQPDEGFRAAAARNKALAAAQGDYIVFIDGDCIAPADFLDNHMRLAEPGHFVAGNRALLSEAFTRRVLASRIDLTGWHIGAWVIARLRGFVNRLLPLLRLPDGALRKRDCKEWRGAKTCNLAAWRTDLLAVNGFDEQYTGWGHEDADLAVRFIRAGVLRKDGRFATGVLHLWHPPNDRTQLAENEQRLAQIINTDRVRAEFGVSQYLPAVR